MKDQLTIQRIPQKATERFTTNMAKPVWQDPQMTCKQCPYCGQDVDTTPCDRCHTRH